MGKYIKEMSAIVSLFIIFIFLGAAASFFASDKTKFVLGPKDGEIALLAVKESKDGYEGSIANMHLEVKKGKGRIFIDTFPLTKVDTQMSARFARDTACKFLDLDCSIYDFFYTIRSESNIIGGPSAGAAIAALTVSVLDSQKIDKKVAVSATIGSGNLIGPVSGLKEKIKAARDKGMKKVVISKGNRILKEGNTTVDLVQFGKNMSIEVLEASNLNDVMLILTGKHYPYVRGNITISKEYSDTMRSLADKLCERTLKLKSIAVSDATGIAVELSEEFVKNKDSAENLTQRSEQAYASKNYYSAASYCFGANVAYRYMSLLVKDYSEDDIMSIIEDYSYRIKDFEETIESKPISTATDLQAYIITMQRISESKENFRDAINRSDDKKAALRLVAQGIERLESAVSWSEFFGRGSDKFTLNRNILKNACFLKLAEAEEMYNYASVFFPMLVNNAKETLSKAKANAFNKRYEMCIFKASKAKAESDVIMGVIGVSSDNLKFLVEKKMDVARQEIVSQIQQGLFPILGYSYYEYARSLKEQDIAASLIYADYAIELSDIGLYVKQKEESRKIFYIDKKLVAVFVIGVGMGMIITLLLGPKQIQKIRKKRI